MLHQLRERALRAGGADDEDDDGGDAPGADGLEGEPILGELPNGTPARAARGKAGAPSASNKGAAAVKRSAAKPARSKRAARA